MSLLGGQSARPDREAARSHRKCGIPPGLNLSWGLQITGQVTSWWQAYTRRLESDPVKTKAVTSFLGFMVGDFLAQRIGGEPFSPLRSGAWHLLSCLAARLTRQLTHAASAGVFGWVRTACSSTAPSATSAPLLLLSSTGCSVPGKADVTALSRRWYKVLDKNVMPNEPRSNAAVLIKTAADQLVWAPIMTVVFFAVLKSLEGHPELIWDTVQVPPCSCLWPAWPAWLMRGCVCTCTCPLSSEHPCTF